ncbi:F-box/LRR-repeat protein At2g43260, partial [Linum grandiflorum]
WKSIIEQDLDFINLHYIDSEVRPVDLHCDGNKGANVHTLKTIQSSNIPEDVKFLGPVRALPCLVDHFAVQIFNVSTRVTTPWVKSAVSNLKWKNSQVYPKCSFGLDPATGNHKVIFLWSKYKEAPPVCEVLTVGECNWRIIDDVPPLELVQDVSVCVNGSVYWLTYKGTPPYGSSEKEVSESLIVFNIGSEQFRIIPMPKFTRMVDSRLLCMYDLV